MRENAVFFKQFSKSKKVKRNLIPLRGNLNKETYTKVKLVRAYGGCLGTKRR